MLPFITNVLISPLRSSSSNTELQVKFQPALIKSMCLKSDNQQQLKPQKPSKQRTTHKAKTRNRRDMPNTYKSNSRCSHSFLKHHLCTFLSHKKRCLPSYLYFDLSWNYQFTITSIMKTRCVNYETFQCLKNRAACCLQHPVYTQGMGRGKKCKRSK